MSDYIGFIGKIVVRAKEALVFIVVSLTCTAYLCGSSIMFYRLALKCLFKRNDFKFLFRIRNTTRKASVIFASSFKFVAFASPTGGLLNYNATAFCFFQKICFAFFKYRQAGTEPKEAASAITDLTSNRNSESLMLSVAILKLIHLI